MLNDAKPAENQITPNSMVTESTETSENAELGDVLGVPSSLLLTARKAYPLMGMNHALLLGTCYLPAWKAEWDKNQNLSAKVKQLEEELAMLKEQQRQFADLSTRLEKLEKHCSEKPEPAVLPGVVHESLSEDAEWVCVDPEPLPSGNLSSTSPLEPGEMGYPSCR